MEATFLISRGKWAVLVPTPAFWQVALIALAVGLHASLPFVQTPTITAFHRFPHHFFFKVWLYSTAFCKMYYYQYIKIYTEWVFGSTQTNIPPSYHMLLAIRCIIPLPGSAVIGIHGLPYMCKVHSIITLSVTFSSLSILKTSLFCYFFYPALAKPLGQV